MTFKEWLVDQFDHDPGMIRELARHSADDGWPGLTYTSECVETHDRFASEIWDAAYEDAESMGYGSVAEFVGSFRRADMASDPHQLKNLLVWYMAERVARDMDDSGELDEMEAAAEVEPDR